MKTGQTCRPTPPASSSGSHVCANTFVSPSRCSRCASSSSRSVWASASNLRTILSAMTAVASTQTFPVHDPATGEVLAEVPRNGAAETRRAIAAAERGAPAWRARPASSARRSARFSDLMLRQPRARAMIMTREQGKPLAEAEAEIGYAAAFLEWIGEEGSASTATRSPPVRPTRGSSC